MAHPEDIQLAGVVTWRNHAKAGYDRLARGVYGHLPTGAMTLYQAQRARFWTVTRAVLKAYEPRRVVLYGVTALQVLGVDLPTSLEDWDRCHLLVPAGTYRPARRSVVAHCTKHLGPTWATCHGLPVLHPVDHWLQLAGADDDLIQVADALMRRQRPLITLDEFQRRLGELKGRPGVQRARRLMAQVVPGTDSLPETRTRLALVRAGLPTPAVNLQVITGTGATYYLDMAYVREKIAVEYDGAGHVGNTTQMARDARRRRDLQDDGWLVITVAGSDLSSGVFVHSVERALVLRAHLR